MIESIYLEIIILLLLSYVLDKKIIPQGIVIFLTLIIMMNEISITTDLRGLIPALLLFSTIIIYSALQVIGDQKNGT